MKEYIDLAIKACDNCHAPYSNYYVGACLVCKDDTCFTGCNIENASYPAGNCAERTAFFKAISEGHKDFKMIIIVGGHNKVLDDTPTPCGICRQVMSEFCDKDFKIVLADSKYNYKEYKLSEMLPFSFDFGDL